MVQERFGYVWTWVKIVSTFSFRQKVSKRSPRSPPPSLSSFPSYPGLTFPIPPKLHILSGQRFQSYRRWLNRAAKNKQKPVFNKHPGRQLFCTISFYLYPPIMVLEHFWNRCFEIKLRTISLGYCRHIIHVSILTNTWKRWKSSFKKLE